MVEVVVEVRPAGVAASPSLSLLSSLSHMMSFSQSTCLCLIKGWGERGQKRQKGVKKESGELKKDTSSRKQEGADKQSRTLTDTHTQTHTHIHTRTYTHAHTHSLSVCVLSMHSTWHTSGGPSRAGIAGAAVPTAGAALPCRMRTMRGGRSCSLGITTTCDFSRVLEA